jgi:hypothetical protein
MGGGNFNFKGDMELFQSYGGLGHDGQVRIAAHDDANQWLLRHLVSPPLPFGMN